MNWKQSYHPYALITVIFWALAYVFSRLAMVHFSPYPLGLLRYVVATIFLAFVVVIGKIRPPKAQDFPWFIACGAGDDGVFGQDFLWRKIGTLSMGGHWD